LDRPPTCAFIRKNKGFAIVAMIADKTNAIRNGMIIDRNISDTTVVTMTMAASHHMSAMRSGFAVMGPPMTYDATVLARWIPRKSSAPSSRIVTFACDAPYRHHPQRPRPKPDLYRIGGSRYGRVHPLSIPRVGRCGIDLSVAIQAPGSDQYRTCPRAKHKALEAFRTADYIEALITAEANQAVTDTMRTRHGLGTLSTPIFPENVSPSGNSRWRHHVGSGKPRLRRLSITPAAPHITGRPTGPRGFVI